MKTRVLFLTLLIGLVVAGFAFARVHRPASTSTRQVLYYVDPMHPAYHSSKPGIAPDCGMQLTPVYADDLDRAVLAAAQSQSVHVTPEIRQLYGIEVAEVQELSGAGTVRVYGRVAADETRVYSVNMGTDGYVKQTAGDAVGNHVSKDQHLATIYSPDFLAVAGGYLSANERTPNASGAVTNAQNATSVQARADRLRNLGMSDVQIDEISSSRKLPEDVYLVSPTDGFILSRNISSGMRFERHAELYRIADLSHIWILPEVFGNDAAAFRPGTSVHLRLPDTGESFVARVSDLLPALDPATHTLQPRLEASNPHFHLRPGMFVDIDLPSQPGKGLTIPSEAVVDTGLAKHVFVETSEGNFEAREIQTGWSAGDRIQVREGLRKGERVVSAGTFLIDSESRLHPTTTASLSSSTIPSQTSE